ncbi:MAG: phage portal protein [Pseudomonadota bacterium]
MAKSKAKSKAATGSPKLTVQSRYDAAGNGRRMRGWRAPSSGPNRAVEGLTTIRNRARDAQRNEWSGASSGRVWTTNLIGTGIVPRPRTTDPNFKAALVALWDTWVPQADADGVLDFYGLQTLATRTWIASGEIFMRLRSRRSEDGLAVPLQVQLLEPDMVPLLDVDSYHGLPMGNRIRSGIELDKLGRRTAYWMYREHPGDRPSGIVLASQLTRVPAAVVRHIYEPLRPGQLRGVSDYAPILARLRGVMDFDDAVLERQKLANLFTLFITRGGLSGDPDLNPITGLPTEHDNSGAPIAALEPGISQELLPGEDVKFSDPPDAGANYADFMRHQHLGVAAGQGTPYELMTGDIKDVSDRTLRVIISEFRRYCEQRQWQIIIPLLCQPIRDAWAESAALDGSLTAAQAVEAKRVTWSPQGWAYIHPTQDVQAKKMEVDAGFKSRSQIITERGDDPDEVDAQRSADSKRADLLELGPKIPPANTPEGG